MPLGDADSTAKPPAPGSPIRHSAVDRRGGARLHLGMQALALLRRALDAAVDAILPPRCLSCGGTVDRQGGFCPSCWAELAWLGPPLCAACGLPFDYDAGGEAMCGACLRQRPLFVRARAALRYDDASRRLLLAFKHGDRLHIAPPCAQWLARAGAELLRDADLIAPVPLHWTRLALRRYNQAAVLANALAALTGVPCVPDLLIRARRTPSQGGLNRAERAANVKRAFRLHPRRREAVGERRILLIDDVYTTGATVSECARLLIASGAARVDVLTLARVTRN